jgi:hypothetical protein
MDDEVIVVAEGINGTVMKINELQVRGEKNQYSWKKIDSVFLEW